MKHLQARLPWILCLALATSLVAACGSSESAEDPQAKRRFISIGTAPVVGGFYLMGGALAEVLNANQGPIHWQVTAEATKGSQENIRRLDSAEIEIALSNAAITYHAVRGLATWEKRHEVAVIMTLAPNIAQFITKAGSGIASLEDMKGHRIAVGPAGAGFEQFLQPLLAAHGVRYDDFSPINATQQAAVDMLKDGAVAAAFLGGSVPHPAIIAASATLDVLFIPFDEDARQSLVEEYAFFDAASVAAGTYKGQDEAFEGMNVGNMHLVTSTDQDEELVYQITKTIFENREAVVERAAAGRAINAQNVVRDTGTAFHPGAIRYYQEIGIWPGPGSESSTD